jgi:hypothetical protein
MIKRIRTKASNSEKMYDRDWNIYEIISPTRGEKCYWYDQSAKPKNGVFRSKIRSRYLVYTENGTMHLREPIYQYGDQLSVRVEYLMALPKTKTVYEVQAFCRNLTEINKQLYETTGQQVSFNKALQKII